MSEVIKQKTRAVGLTSIGNPLTLIASFEKFKRLCKGYKIYVMLNVARECNNPQNIKHLTEQTYKICQYYQKFFSEVLIIENTARDWMTHGLCLDTLFTLTTEDEMVFFEEDAFLTDKVTFDNWFNQLKDNHLHCVVAPQNPNNFGQLFSKLGIFHGAVNMPGKESIFFVRRDILELYDWPAFDYIKWENHFVYKPNSHLELKFNEEIHFDTFEFFSLNCWMNKSIKKSVYEEHNFDYWVSEGRGNIDEFFRKHASPPPYIHYFNGALFQYLDYHDKGNRKFYYDMVHEAPHFGQFMYHMSTFLIHYSIMLTIKKRYVEICGIEEYKRHKKSLKNAITMLFNYFGYYTIKKKFKMHLYFKFACRHSRKVHYLSEDIV